MQLRERGKKNLLDLFSSSAVTSLEQGTWKQNESEVFLVGDTQRCEEIPVCKPSYALFRGQLQPYPTCLML